LLLWLKMSRSRGAQAGEQRRRLGSRVLCVSKSVGAGNG
jgi:hypothetical protein